MKMKTARLSIYFINHLLIWLPFIFFLTLAQQSNSQTVLENFKPCVSYYLSGDQLVGGDVGIPNDLHRDYVAEDTFSFTLNFAYEIEVIIETTIGDAHISRNGTVTVDGVSQSIQTTPSIFQTVSHFPDKSISYTIHIEGTDMTLNALVVKNREGQLLYAFDFGILTNNVEPNFIEVTNNNDSETFLTTTDCSHTPTEICRNGIDDDGDGLIDCDDPDCDRPVVYSISTIPPSNCPHLDNGQLIIGADSPYLEISIDGGITYQRGTIFQNFSAGLYPILLRDSLTGCVVFQEAFIDSTSSSCSEICDNTIDDDGDGLIDFLDNDCNDTSNVIYPDIIPAFEFTLKILQPEADFENRWGVYAKPTEGFDSLQNRSLINSSQVTILMNHTKDANPMLPIDGVLGGWHITNSYTTLDSTYDYFFVSLWDVLDEDSYFENDKETLLFTFQTAQSCPDTLGLLDPTADPYLEEMLQKNINPGQQIMVLNTSTWNAYQWKDNYDPLAYKCTDCDLDGLPDGLSDFSKAYDCYPENCEVYRTLDMASFPPTNCNLDNGTIIINVIGTEGAVGTSLAYSIDEGATFQFSNVFSNLLAGEYVIWVRDISGFCVDEFHSITLTPDITTVFLDSDLDGLTNCEEETGIDSPHTSRTPNGNISDPFDLCDPPLPDFFLNCPPDITLNCNDPIDSIFTNYQATIQHEIFNYFMDSIFMNYQEVIEETDSLTLIIVRSWTATDICGTSVSCSQVVTIDDSHAPVLTCAPDITIHCDQSTDPTSTGQTTGTDDCIPSELIVITFEDGNTGILDQCGGHQGVIVRIWMGTDMRGNSNICRQIITVVDQSNPSITCPPDILIDCEESTSPPLTGQATALDNCSAIDLIGFIYEDSIYNESLICNEVIIRTWIAMDECNNWSTCQQRITLRDTLSPILGCPPDITITCDPASPYEIIDPIVIDNCTPPSLVEIGIVDTLVTPSNCGTNDNLLLIWMATDACGNTATCEQRVMVVDTQTLTLICAPDLTMSCGIDTIPSIPEQPTVLDNCGDFSLTYEEMETTFTTGFECHTNTEIRRVWTAFNICGNTSTCEQKINIIDDVPPTIVCKPDITVNCTYKATILLPHRPSFSDNCNLGRTSFQDSIIEQSNLCGSNRDILRTWAIKDFCGNISTCVQKVSVRDDQPPTLSCATDITINCGASLAPIQTGFTTATDDCGSLDSSSITYFDIDEDILASQISDQQLITRVWFGTDRCGNVDSCFQLITLNDVLPPLINCASDITINCDNATETIITGYATAEDNCSTVKNITITFEDFNAISGRGTVEQFTRIWKAVDESGNESTCDQAISIVDNQAPLLRCPPDTLLTCPIDSFFVDLGQPTLFDNCGNSEANLTYFDTLIVSSPTCISRSILRIWRAEDGSHTSTCEQTISLVDNQAPIIICAADTVVTCNLDFSINTLAEPIAWDNCSQVDLSYVDTIVVEGIHCTNEMIRARIWTATDACGNTATCEQLLQVMDTIAPLMNCPPDITIDCDQPITPTLSDYPLVEDQCAVPDTILPTYADETVGLFDPCGAEAGDIVRIWQAVDACGNETTCQQIIVLQQQSARVHAKIFLEGYYNPATNEMPATLMERGLVPYYQPYNAAPWHYAGVDSVFHLPSYIVDWVLVMTREMDGSILDQAVGFVTTSGELVGVDGIVGIPIDHAIGNYISIHHRSHLAVVSAIPYFGEVYDFTVSDSQAMGNQQLKKKGGYYALFAGDYDASGVINSTDLNLWKRHSAALFEYLPVDGDGNAIVNSLDYNLWTRNRSKIGVPAIWY